jgi:hypothetical protein
MENYTTFISSRGIMRSCDYYTANPQSSSNHIEIPFQRGQPAHKSIYVCSDAIEKFCLEVEPMIDCQYTLVSGDSDREITDEICEKSLVSKIILNSKMKSWYAQNLTYKHPKLKNLPIGLDYHTVHEKPYLWGLKAHSPLAQELTLIDVLQRSSLIENRFFAAYCNWQFAMNRGDRSECLQKIDKQLCFFEPDRLPRTATWSRQSEFMFVISPFGAGLDCHRTWEALMLGCIPIIRRSGISSLFDNLPVLQLENWTDLTKDMMLATYKDFLSKKFDFTTLFLNPWTKKFRETYENQLPPMLMSEFRQFMRVSVS